MQGGDLELGGLAKKERGGLTGGVRLGPGRWLSTNEEPPACSLSRLSCDPRSSSISDCLASSLMPPRLTFPAICGVMTIVPAR